MLLQKIRITNLDAQFQKSSFDENETLYLFIWEKCDFSFVNLDKIIEKLEKIGFSYTYNLILLLMTTFKIVIIIITISRILYRLWRKLRYMYYVAQGKYKAEANEIELGGGGHTQGISL